MFSNIYDNVCTVLPSTFVYCWVLCYSHAQDVYVSHSFYCHICDPFNTTFEQYHHGTGTAMGTQCIPGFTDVIEMYYSMFNLMMGLMTQI